MKTQQLLSFATRLTSMTIGTILFSQAVYAEMGEIAQSTLVRKFQMLDRDGDGTLTVSEAGQDKLFTAAAYAKADINQDGGLNQREYTDYRSAIENREARRVKNDSVITSKVKDNISKQAGLEVTVETYKGTVLLSGYAENHEQINLAENIAKEIDGVKSVKNSLILKGRQPTAVSSKPAEGQANLAVAAYKLTPR